jgi:predicted nucleic acid-binding protein
VTKSIFLDASAIVKLVIDEKGSDQLRKYLEVLHHPCFMFTTNFCFFESLSVLKRKWCTGEMNKKEYIDCCRLLFAYKKNNTIRIEEYPLQNLRDFQKLECLFEKHNIDVSDCLQLLSIKETMLSIFAGGSETTLITTDRGLAKSAKKEGVKSELVG